MADPRIDYPDYPDGSVVELRVHGVGGEPPSVMARDPNPELVARDGAIGVYRARNPIVQTFNGGDGKDGKDGDNRRVPVHVREVVSWGGQTSGSKLSALWILLLPFAMLNAAGRMHAGGRHGTAQRSVVRLLAVTMTLTVVGLACTIGMDLVAQQYVPAWAAAACEGGSAVDADPDLEVPTWSDCVEAGEDLPWWLVPFRPYIDDAAGRSALAAVMPSLALILLWVAGRAAKRDPAKAGTPGTSRDADGAGGVGEPVRLVDGRFWRTAVATSRLRGLHVTAGTAWIACTLATSLLGVGDEEHVARLVVVVTLAVVVATLVLSVLPRVVAEQRVLAIDIPLVVLRGLSLGALSLLMGRWLPGGSDRFVEWIAGEVVTRRWAVVLVAVVAGVAILSWVVITGLRAGRDARAWPNLGLVGGALLLGALVGDGLDARVESLGWRWTQTTADWLLEPAGGLLEVLPVVPDVPGLLGRTFHAPYLPLVLLGVVQVLGLGALALAGYRSHPSWSREGDSKHPRSQLDTGRVVPFGLAAWMVAMLSLFLTVAVGAGLHGLVADVLGDRVISDVGEAGRPLFLAPWLGMAAKVLLVVLVAILLALAIEWWRRRVAPAARDVADHQLAGWAAVGRGLEQGAPGEPAVTVAASDAEGVGSAWTWQWLLRRAGSILFVGVVAGLAALLALLVAERQDEPVWWSLSALEGVALAVVVGIPVLGIELLRRAYREQTERRNLARIWDVLTFWPRVGHPLAPPCYAEQLVETLQQRIDRIVTVTWSPADVPVDRDADHMPNRVVLAGHSQGSIIAMATMLQLQPDIRERVALVTYGSPIAILYERWFREAFGPLEAGSDAHAFAVASSGHSWHHVFGLTEPFAMPFWEVSPAGQGPAVSASGGDGWSLTLGVPSIGDCAICEPGAWRQHVDLTLPDPVWWDRARPVVTLEDGRVGVRLPRHLGHSVYRSNPDLDAHLQTIAQLVRAPVPPPEEDA